MNVGCLDETTIARLLDRALTATEATAVAGHVDGCPECRRLLAVLADSQVADNSATDDSPFASAAPRAHPLDVGDGDPGARVRVGRYELVRCIGHGATGSVFAAHDPDLGREIAIKLVRLDATLSDATRLRLRREAKALAKLSHPNVVAVYDTGTFEDQLFIAMELVPSGTLRDWLKTERKLDEILAVMADAARGLAAIHACGLVHRDIKPENVLVDATGRVRIGDLGLVLAHDEAPETGALVGTPSYMAPEQLASRGVDARSDQFSFCVTFAEAIYGERPFSGGSIELLAAAAAAGLSRPLEPVAPRGRVPRRVRAVLERGLAADPAARFESVDAMAIALGADRRTRTQRTAAVLVAGVAIGIAGVIALQAGTALDDPCNGAAREIDTAWSRDGHGKLAAAFASTGSPLAADTARRVVQSLDRYAAAWSVKRREVCRSAGTERALRAECLSARQRDVAALVAVLEAADPDVVVRAVDAVGALRSLETCDGVPQRRQAAPVDPVAHARRVALATQLSTLGALSVVGRHREALALGRQIVERSRDSQEIDLRVSALQQLGELVAMTGELGEGRALLEQAIAAADRAGLDIERADAWIRLVKILSDRGSDVATASRLAPLADAAVARLGPMVDPTLEVTWLYVQGCLLDEQGDARGALHKFRTATERAAARLGEVTSLYLASLSAMIGVELALGSRDIDRAEATRLVDLYARLYGEHHDDTAGARIRAGEILLANRQDDAAAVMLRTAIVDLEQARGGSDPTLAVARTRLAAALANLGRHSEATAESARALELRTALFPADHPLVLESLIQRGVLEGARGDHAAAIATLEGARERLRARSPLGRDVAAVEKALGDENLAIGKLAAAEKHYRSLVVLEGGGESARSVGALVDLGLLLVRAKRFDDAEHTLERALEIALRVGRSEELAAARLALARALVDRDRDRAHELAVLALAAYERLGYRTHHEEAAALIAKLGKGGARSSQP
jgi:tetratricopeptide (TPR) repeat protein